MKTLFWSLTAFALPLAVSAANNYGLDDAAVKAGYKKAVTLEIFIRNLVNGAFGVLGLLFLAMVLYGGYNWMTAMGNEEKIDQGKSALIWATIGLVVIIAGYAITTFVITNVYKGQ